MDKMERVGILSKERTLQMGYIFCSKHTKKDKWGEFSIENFLFTLYFHQLVIVIDVFLGFSNIKENISSPF